MTQHASTPPPTGQGRKLVLVVAGLAAVVVVMLCAFALPSVSSGPHNVPVGITGPQGSVTSVSKALSGDEWDVTVYDSTKALTSAVQNRDIMGGIALSTDGVTAYTATAGGPSAASAITSTATALADQHRADVTITGLKPFTADDPKGSGFTAAAMPMIFGGMIPAMLLSSLFPGHSGLRVRLAGAFSFALVAGFATTALLQFGTGSLDGNYWITGLGMSLGMAALAVTLLGLHSLMGMVGYGVGAAVTMFLGNPLSGLASGPHWLPNALGSIGQLLPPGASGSLLRANAFFGGTGAGPAILTLSCWVVFGFVLCVVADRRGRRKAVPDAADAATPAPATQVKPV